MKVTVLIPAFNEGKNIAHTIKGLENVYYNFCQKNQLELDIIVIDDGSQIGRAHV